MTPMMPPMPNLGTAHYYAPPQTKHTCWQCGEQVIGLSTGYSCANCDCNWTALPSQLTSTWYGWSYDKELAATALNP